MFPFYIAPPKRPHQLLVSLQEISPVLVLVGLGAILVLSLVRILASAGVIEAVSGYKKGQKTSLVGILKKGGIHYWPMFLLHLLMDAFFILAVFGMGIVFRLFKVMGFGGACFNAILFLILLAIFISLLISLGVAFAFAERYLVLADKGIWTSWKAGLSLYNRHRTLSIRLGFLQASFWFITFLVAIVPVILLSGAPLVRNLVLAVLLIGVNLILGATFHAMYTSAWFDLKEKDSGEPQAEPEKPVKEPAAPEEPEKEPDAKDAEDPEEVDNP
jgi:hypothetical protein